MGGKFAEIMKLEKIESDSGPPYTPQLNGVAERFNKTIKGKIRALMCDYGLLFIHTILLPINLLIMQFL